jgi:hypothetical protein
MSYAFSIYDDEPAPLDPCPHGCGADGYTECGCEYLDD